MRATLQEQIIAHAWPHEEHRPGLLVHPGELLHRAMHSAAAADTVSPMERIRPAPCQRPTSGRAQIQFAGQTRP